MAEPHLRGDTVQSNELQRHILTLANLEEAAEPVVSCYLDLGTRYRESMSERVRSLGSKLDRRMRVPFWEALGRIEVFLGTGVRPEARGAAIFARGGDRAFFLPLQFGAALPIRVTAGARPHIYPLVELKHDYSNRMRSADMRVSRADETEALALLESLHKEMTAGALSRNTQGCAAGILIPNTCDSGTGSPHHPDGGAVHPRSSW